MRLGYLLRSSKNSELPPAYGEVSVGAWDPSTGLQNTVFAGRTGKRSCTSPLSPWTFWAFLERAVAPNAKALYTPTTEMAVRVASREEINRILLTLTLNNGWLCYCFEEFRMMFDVYDRALAVPPDAWHSPISSLRGMFRISDDECPVCGWNKWEYYPDVKR